MHFNVRDMDIATGGPLVAILHKKDAEHFDLHFGDRIKIIKGKRVETVVVDIAESEKAVPKGQIGLLEEVLSSLKLKNNDKVEIQPARKPLSLDYIKKKLDGYTLTKKEIYQIAWDISHNKLSDIELTYFVSACYSHALNSTETALLTKAIAEQGDILKLNRYPIIDKHCIGGVAGNRTTMLIVPIIAAAGLIIPKTSSRSITSPAGTADTMEVLAKVSFPLNKIKQLVLKHHGCMVWGGALNLAPSDDKIIRVEKPLSIDAESQLLASIMAKKYSVSSTHILIDIPTGKGAKITSYRRAITLKNHFSKLAKKLKKIVKVIITDGSQPIGNGIGPALEARDILWILKNDSKGPQDLKNKSIRMAGIILEMAGKTKNGKKMAAEILDSGLAYKKMVEIIKAQQGRITKPEQIKLGRFKEDVLSPRSGKVKSIDNHEISKIARYAGAPLSKGAGIYLYKHVKDPIKKGEKLFTIYAENKDKLEYALEAYKSADGIIIS